MRKKGEITAISQKLDATRYACINPFQTFCLLFNHLAKVFFVSYDYIVA